MLSVPVRFIGYQGQHRRRCAGPDPSHLRCGHRRDAWPPHFPNFPLRVESVRSIGYGRASVKVCPYSHRPCQTRGGHND
jgi:hypothetical protein